jgi:hypothetical protein
MQELIRIENGVGFLAPETIEQIVEFERIVKAAKEGEEKLKAAILDEMENKGIIKLDSDKLAITYVAPTTRESFDSKALRADLPEVYDAYAKISQVKASVRIKVK